MFIKRLSYCLCVVSVLLCMSCVNTVSRGHLKEDETLSQVKVGTTTRSEVQKIMGSPSSESSFGPKTWFYVSSIMKTRAIVGSSVGDQRTVEITFDQNDVVSAIKEYSLADSKNIQVVKRVTPSEGQHLGFFEQIVANLGRFNKNSDNGISNNHGHSSTNPSGYPGR